MSRWIRYFSTVLILFLLVACKGADPKTMMYAEAFEEILFIDGAYLEEVDYISIYINEDHVSEDRLAYIQQHLADLSATKVYTYEKEEIDHAGPYGKEDLREHGIFMYLSLIEKRDNQTYIIGEKHYTRGNHPSVEKEMFFE